MKRDQREKDRWQRWPAVREIKKNETYTHTHERIKEACLATLEATGTNFSKLRACQMSGNPSLYCPFRGLGPINWDYEVEMVSETINGAKPKAVIEREAYYRKSTHFLAITDAGLELLNNGAELSEVDPVQLIQAHPQRSGGFPTEGWVISTAKKAMPLLQTLLRTTMANTTDQRRKRAGMVAGWVDLGLVSRENARAILIEDWRPGLIPTIEEFMKGVD